MFSQAAKTYNRIRNGKPFSKNQRQQIYSSNSVNVEKKVGQKKFSPFNTVGRASRSSYLLRVTKQPNTQTNYYVNESFIKNKDRVATIDKAKCKRFIGSIVKDYSVSLDLMAPERCKKSVTHSPRKPLTVRDHQNWRKTHQHFDFKRQPSTKRIKQFPKLSLEQQTNDSFMKTLRETTESNFNNFNRCHQPRPSPRKAHDFNSDFGHQYLKQVEIRQKSPEYDILKANEQFTRKSLGKPKGSVQFGSFREKILTRKDRSDPFWNTMLEFNVKNPESAKGQIFFDQQLSRKPNDIHSKYPSRHSLVHITKLKQCH